MQITQEDLAPPGVRVWWTQYPGRKSLALVVAWEDHALVNATPTWAPGTRPIEDPDWGTEEGCYHLCHVRDLARTVIRPGIVAQDLAPIMDLGRRGLSRVSRERGKPFWKKRAKVRKRVGLVPVVGDRVRVYIRDEFVKRLGLAFPGRYELRIGEYSGVRLVTAWAPSADKSRLRGVASCWEPSEVE